MESVGTETIREAVRVPGVKPAFGFPGFLRLAIFALTLSLNMSLLVPLSEAAQISIAWDPNTEEDLAGYRVYYGVASREYGQPITIGKETTHTITGLVPGGRYYIAVTAFDTANNESDYSNEVNGIASIVTGWDFDISRKGKGGATLRFNETENRFRGYGISTEMGFFRIEGNYSVRSDGIIDGECTFHDFEDEEATPETCSFRGEINDQKRKLVFQVKKAGGGHASVKMRGEKYSEGDHIPGEWVVKISGSAKGRIEPMRIEQYGKDGQVFPHLFRISGTGTIDGEGEAEISGNFFLTWRNNVCGIGQLIRSISESGFLSGRLDPVSGRFKLKMKGEQGNRYTIIGQVTD